MWSVMLVDDEPGVLEGLQNHIEWSALEASVVCTASNGQEALALFQRHMPHIVMTDIYMPGMDGLDLMESIHRDAPSTVFVVLSGYDQFDYARRSLQFGAVDYVLKPATVDEIALAVARAVQRCREGALRQRLVASLPALRENFLLRLLREEPDPEEARFLGMSDLLQGPFAVAVVSVDRPPGLSEEEWQLARLEIRESAAGEGRSALPFLGSEMPVLLHRPHDPDGWARALLERVQEGSPVQVTIGLSRICETAAEAYGQAQEALGFKEILGSSRVIAISRVESDPEAIPPYPVDRNRLLMEALRIGDESEVRRLVHDAFRHLSRAPLPYVRAVAIDLYGLGAIAMSERDQSADDVLPAGRFWDSICAVASAAEMEPLVSECLGEMASRLNVRRETRHQKVLAAIDEMIAARYAEDLTMDEVARHVYLSRTYVAYLFKQVRGVSFLDHLTRFRMEKARELLRTTDLAVYEVAERVGYRNPAYFARLFKQHAGVMPSEIRKRN